jgi:hypothetical protein
MGLARVLVVAASVLATFGARPAPAYEYEHYAWTYFIAVHMGFTERQAFQIASATYAVDWDDHTGPMTAGMSENLTVLAAGAWTSLREKWTKFHAFTSHETVYDGRRAGKTEAEIEVEAAAFKAKAQEVLWLHALRQRNPGPYLHYVQDLAPHHGWTDLYGHGSAAHFPDFASWDEAAFRKMTADTVRELRAFRDHACAGTTFHFCTRPLRDPDPAALERAFQRLLVANPIVANVDDRAALFRDLMALSTRFEPMSRTAEWLRDPGALFPDDDPTARIVGTMAANLGLAVNGISGILETRQATFRGTRPSVAAWLTETPAPAEDPTRKVIVEELAAAKTGTAPLIAPLEASADPGAFGEIGADMPRAWLPYTFDSVGAITGPGAAIGLEDVRAKLPADGEITVTAEGPYKDGNDTVYIATLRFTVALEGMADLPFLPQLPVAVVSTPDPKKAPEVFRKRLDTRATLDVEHYVSWREAELPGEEVPWVVEVHVYGLPKVTRTWKLVFPKRNTCNSAVDQGGDEGGGVTVDLGDFTGPAGFTWEMYDIKDEMRVKIGAEEKTTGCVSGTGVFRFDVPPGARTAEVKVIPNCEGNTSGTQWTFTFECPLRSAVTADGTGKPVPGTAPPIPDLPPMSIPVPVNLPLPSDLLGPTDNSVQSSPAVGAARDIEPNGTEALAEPVALPAGLTGTFDGPGDVDFVILDAPAGGEVVLASQDPAAAPEAGVYAAPGGPWLPDQSPPGDGRLVIDLPGPGRYVLRLAPPPGTTAPVPYTLAALFRAAADPFEPNDAPAIAAPLATDGRLIGAILPRGDTDFFAVTFPAAGEWTLAIAASPAAILPDPGVYPASGGPWLPDQSPPGDGRLVVDIPAPGRYMLRIVDVNGQRSPDPYAIDLAFAPSPDRGEPNGTEATATPVAPDATVEGTILPRGDTDFLVTEVAAAGTWRIAVAEAPAGITPGPGVYPAIGGPWLPDMSPPGDGLIEVDLPAPGRYVLRVVDEHGGRSPAPWKLTLAFAPSAETGEPNNTAESAAPAPLAGAIEGTILPRGDVDFRIVEATEAGEWRLAIADRGSTVGLDFGVYPAPGGPWLPDLTPPGDGVLAVDLPAPGRYVAMIHDPTGARGPLPWKIDATFVPAGEAHEPNDREAMAARIAADGAITGAFLPAGDADFFIATLPGPGEWEVTVTGTPPGIAPAAGVYAAVGGPWLPDLTPPGDGILRVKIPAGGAYVLRVVEANGLRRAATWTLSTAFRPE